VVPTGTNTLSQSFASAYARLGNVTSANLSKWELEDAVANTFQLDASLSPTSFEQEVAAGSNDTVASVANAVTNGIQISFAPNGSIIKTGLNIGSTFYGGAGVSEIITEGSGNVPSGAISLLTSIDAIYYKSGDGKLEINGQGSASETSNQIIFGASITASQLTFSQGTNNSVIVTDGTAGDQITIDNMLTTSYDNGLTTLVFSNGSTLTNYQVDSDILATGSATQTSLTDGLGNATFDSKTYAHTENRQLSGGNSFVYNTGYGILDISDENESTSVNTVQFGTGIASYNIALTKSCL